MPKTENCRRRAARFRPVVDSMLCSALLPFWIPLLFSSAVGGARAPAAPEAAPVAQVLEAAELHAALADDAVKHIIVQEHLDLRNSGITAAGAATSSIQGACGASHPPEPPIDTAPLFLLLPNQCVIFHDTTGMFIGGDTTFSIWVARIYLRTLARGNFSVGIEAWGPVTLYMEQVTLQGSYGGEADERGDADTSRGLEVHDLARVSMYGCIIADMIASDAPAALVSDGFASFADCKFASLRSVLPWTGASAVLLSEGAAYVRIKDSVFDQVYVAGIGSSGDGTAYLDPAAELEAGSNVSVALSSEAPVGLFPVQDDLELATIKRQAPDPFAPPSDGPPPPPAVTVTVLAPWPLLEAPVPAPGEGARGSSLGVGIALIAAGVIILSLGSIGFILWRRTKQLGLKRHQNVAVAEEPGKQGAGGAKLNRSLSTNASRTISTQMSMDRAPYPIVRATSMQEGLQYPAAITRTTSLQESRSDHTEMAATPALGGAHSVSAGDLSVYVGRGPLGSAFSTSQMAGLSSM